MEHYFFLTSAAYLTPWENKLAQCTSCLLKSPVFPVLQTALCVYVRLLCVFDQSSGQMSHSFFRYLTFIMGGKKSKSKGEDCIK